MSTFGTVLTFLFTFGLGLSVNVLFAGLELLENLCFSGFGAAVPGVLLEFIHGDALGRVELSQLLEEILKLLAVNAITTFSFVVSFPEEVSAISSQKAVVRIVRLGTVERRSL